MSALTLRKLGHVGGAPDGVWPTLEKVLHDLGQTGHGGRGLVLRPIRRQGIVPGTVLGGGAGCTRWPWWTVISAGISCRHEGHCPSVGGANKQTSKQTNKN